jgi:uncharacterized protein involved in exopolysaccharide biosynthesis
MANPISAPLRPQDLLHAFRTRIWSLLTPGIIGALAALGFVFVRPATWEATQALMVRDEAARGIDASGHATHPGQFGQADAMKAVQETVLELCHSQSVLEQSLKEVGPPPDYENVAAWPTIRDIEELLDDSKLAPPKGAEFGKTEVFYLKVTAVGKERALALASALSHNLQARFEEFRKTRAQGVTRELEKTVSLAKADLEKSTRALTMTEISVGRDLAELRMLNEAPAGESDLRKMTVDLETELRTQRSALKANQELHNLLKQGQEDPGRMVASPNRLLESQPGLKRLKDGLVDAQLASAKLQGLMSPDHPLVQAAKSSEQEVSQHLHDELAIAIRGVEAEVRLGADRLVTLENERQRVEERRDQLAKVRADYANLVSMTKHYTEIMKAAQLQLSEARATEASAHQSSLLNLVDLPETGSKPVGPGKTLIVLGGLFGGLALGAAWLFVTLQPGEVKVAAPLPHVVETVTEPIVPPTPTRPRQPAAPIAPPPPLVEAASLSGSMQTPWGKLLREAAAAPQNFGATKPY